MDSLRPRILLNTCQDSNMKYKNDVIKSPYVQKLMKYVDFVSFCPEERILQDGEYEELKIIRKSSDGRHRLLGVKSKKDYSEDVIQLSKSMAKEFKSDEIDGFLFKSKRALTGVKLSKVYRNVEKDTIVTSHHRGFLTQEIQKLYPLHVVTTDRMLRNEFERDMFLINIFTRARFRSCKNIECLLKFHQNNRDLLMMYNQTAYRRMGQIVRNSAKYSFKKVHKQYEEELFNIIQKYISVKRSTSMLDHLYAHFKKELKLRERMHFNDLLKQYKEQKASLSVLLELLKSYVVRFEDDYLLTQTIFEPFPWELNRY